MKIERLSKNQGFTLIEMILVLAILGILALMAVPSIRQLVSDQNEIGRIAATAEVNSASKQYEAEYGEAATDVSHLENSKMVKLNQNNYNYHYDKTTGVASVSIRREQ